MIASAAVFRQQCQLQLQAVKYPFKRRPLTNAKEPQLDEISSHGNWGPRNVGARRTLKMGTRSTMDGGTGGCPNEGSQAGRRPERIIGAKSAPLLSLAHDGIHASSRVGRMRSRRLTQTHCKPDIRSISYINYRLQ